MNAEMNLSDDSLDLPESPLEQARLLESILITLAQNGGLDEAIYHQLRSYFMKGTTKSLLPKFVQECRDSRRLWSHLKPAGYDEHNRGDGIWDKRCNYIYDTFEPLIKHLERPGGVPADAVISETLASLDAEGVNQAWERALERREKDPEGAITAARTLLETVCMHILDEAGEIYDKDNLPKLYQKAAETLNLAPSQHTEESFKSILGSCKNVVQSLGTLRNKIGDAHGQGRRPVKPAPRHAALAVNLAGSMATFLVETWRSQNK